MSIFITVDRYDFQNAFHNANRHDNFSTQGLDALFDMLEELGEDVELDVIALCCDYQEMELDEIINAYSIDGIDDDMDENEKIRIVEEYLSEYGWWQHLKNGNFIFQLF